MGRRTVTGSPMRLGQMRIRRLGAVNCMRRVKGRGRTTAS
jgi:hypothetical protein